MFGKKKKNPGEIYDPVALPEDEYSVLIHFVKPTPCVYVKKNESLEPYDGVVIIDLEYTNVTVAGNFVIADCLSKHEVSFFLDKFNMNGTNSIRFDV